MRMLDCQRFELIYYVRICIISIMTNILKLDLSKHLYVGSVVVSLCLPVWFIPKQNSSNSETHNGNMNSKYTRFDSRHGLIRKNQICHCICYSYYWIVLFTFGKYVVFYIYSGITHLVYAKPVYRHPHLDTFVCRRFAILWYYYNLIPPHCSTKRGFDTSSSVLQRPSFITILSSCAFNQCCREKCR